MARVLIRDVTLREGGEVPGVNLSMDQQLEIAAALADSGIGLVEVAGPASTGPGITLARAIRHAGLPLQPVLLFSLFDAALDAKIDQVCAQVENPMTIEVCMPVSSVRLAAMGFQPQGASAWFSQHWRWQSFSRPGITLGLGFIDALRANFETIAEMVRIAGAAVRYCTLYDTVGVGTPERLSDWVQRFQAVAAGKPVWVHCHNDHGLATANTLAAVAAGATGVDLSVNGLGDRSGNAALEEVVVGLERLYGVTTGVTLAKLTRLSRLVERLTRVSNSPLKPIVGKFSFTHAAPSHLSIVRLHPEVFEPFDPSLVGGKRLVVGH